MVSESYGEVTNPLKTVGNRPASRNNSKEPAQTYSGFNLQGNISTIKYVSSGPNSQACTPKVAPQRKGSNAFKEHDRASELTWGTPERRI